MREIKFRGKVKGTCKNPNGLWVYGFPYNEENKWAICYDAPGTFGQSRQKVEPVIPNTIGQYIGLEDNDGISIYEGDIIEKFCNNRHIGGEIKRYEVVYDGESFCLKINGGLFGFGNRDGKILKKEKVIGNIYDNPELLSGSEV